jgi:hypothetical protein
MNNMEIAGSLISRQATSFVLCIWIYGNKNDDDDDDDV